MSIEAAPRCMRSDRRWARRIVTEAFVRNPNLRWTPIGLSEWWGLRIDLVNAIVRELAADRVIDRVPDSGDHYILRAVPERV